MRAEPPLPRKRGVPWTRVVCTCWKQTRTPADRGDCGLSESGRSDGGGVMNVEGWRERLDLAAGRGMQFDVVPGLAARVAQVIMPISVVQGGRATAAT